MTNKKSTEKRTETHACDLISRQGAIDAINTSRMLYSGTWGKGLSMAVDKLRNLPSVQPELIAQDAYIRGFEQGRTQGMIDSQGGKK